MPDFNKRQGAKGREITFLIAPNVPQQELSPLEELYKEALAYPEYALVVNYDLSVYSVEIDPSNRVIVSAPDASEEQILQLRQRINDTTDTVIAVNYEVGLQSVPIEL